MSYNFYNTAELLRGYDRNRIASGAVNPIPQKETSDEQRLRLTKAYKMTDEYKTRLEKRNDEHLMALRRDSSKDSRDAILQRFDVENEEALNRFITKQIELENAKVTPSSSKVDNSREQTNLNSKMVTGDVQKNLKSRSSNSEDVVIDDFRARFLAPRRSPPIPPPKDLEYEKAVKQSLEEAREAEQLQHAIKESEQMEHERQTRIAGNVSLLDERLPNIRVTFKQLGAWLMPFTQTGEPHSTFAAMSDSTRAIDTIHQSCSLFPVKPRPELTFVKLTFNYIYGNASGVNARLLNNREYLYACCNKLGKSLKLYIDGPAMYVAQGRNYSPRQILSDIVVFIERVMPDNFPNKQQSMEIMFQEILQDSATANSEDGIMTQDTPTTGNWSCSQGTFDRIFIQLGVSINKYTDNKPSLTVETVNAQNDYFFTEMFNALQTQRPGYLSGSNPPNVQQATQDLTEFVTRRYVGEGSLQENSQNYNAVVQAILGKSRRFVQRNLDAYIEMANYSGGKKKRKTSKRRKTARRKRNLKRRTKKHVRK